MAHFRCRGLPAEPPLSLPTRDLLSALLGAPEYLQAGIWPERGSFGCQMNGGLFLYSLCSATELNISGLSYGTWEVRQWVQWKEIGWFLMTARLGQWLAPSTQRDERGGWATAGGQQGEPKSRSLYIS